MLPSLPLFLSQPNAFEVALVGSDGFIPILLLQWNVSCVTSQHGLKDSVSIA